MSKINRESLTIGGDPELFLVDLKSGKVASAIGKIPGTKEQPYKIKSLGDGYALQTDCCSVEYNIPPVKTAVEFYENNQKMIKFIKSKLKNDYDLSFETSAEFTKEELFHPQAQLAGCSVDFNAWTVSANQKPDFASTNVRCNGAHLHFGYDDHNEEVSMELIKALDLTLGVTSVLLDPNTERRKLYGRAGCFRFTNFGIEYRTPSPYYLKSQELVNHVFRAIDKAVELVNSDFKYSDEHQLKIQTCINTADLTLAYELIEEFKLEEILPKGVLVN